MNVKATQTKRGITRGVRLDIETDNRICKIAECEDRSISYVLNRLIKQALTQQEDKQ